MAKTMKEAARTAIQIQDGCNLSGILGAFHTILCDAGEIHEH